MTLEMSLGLCPREISWSSGMYIVQPYTSLLLAVYGYNICDERSVGSCALCYVCLHEDISKSVHVNISTESQGVSGGRDRWKASRGREGGGRLNKVGPS